MSSFPQYRPGGYLPTAGDDAAVPDQLRVAGGDERGADARGRRAQQDPPRVRPPPLPGQNEDTPSSLTRTGDLADKKRPPPWDYHRALG